MADTAAPASNGGANNVDTLKGNAAAAFEKVANGPIATNVVDQKNKTVNDFSNLAASRATPSNPAATGQPLTHYHSFFSSLLSWENPRASAIAFASIVSLIFAVRYLDVLRWAFKITWMILGVTIAAEVVGKLVMNQGLATQLRPRKYYTVPKQTLDAMIGDVHELINFFVIEAQRIMFAENVSASIVACVGAFISYYLVKIMPYWGLALVATTLAFAVPPLYTSNQELIDQQIHHASELLSSQTAQLRDVASKHTAQATNITKQYVGDYTAKAQQMLGVGQQTGVTSATGSSTGKATQRSTSSKISSAPSAGSSYLDSDFPAAPTDQFKSAKPETKEPLLS